MFGDEKFFSHLHRIIKKIELISLFFFSLCYVANSLRQMKITFLFFFIHSFFMRIFFLPSFVSHTLTLNGFKIRWTGERVREMIWLFLFYVSHALITLLYSLSSHSLTLAHQPPPSPGFNRFFLLSLYLKWTVHRLH